MTTKKRRTSNKTDMTRASRKKAWDFINSKEKKEKVLC
jgi:hypothetical protein